MEGEQSDCHPRQDAIIARGCRTGQGKGCAFLCCEPLASPSQIHDFSRNKVFLCGTQVAQIKN